MYNDQTNVIEDNIQSERLPRFKYLLKLFMYAFSSAKFISIIYLSIFILLSFLRPLLAFVWGKYIQTAESHISGDQITPAVFLILGYFILNYLIDIIGRYVTPNEEIERLDLVQANHQEELMQSKMFEKLASISPEYLEIPKVNDKIEQVFSFVGNRWNGMNSQVMLQSYIVIAKIVSVITISLSLYIFNPWLCLLVLIVPLPSLWSLTVGEKLRFIFIKENTKLVRKTRYFQDLMLSPASKELKILGLYDFFYNKWKYVANEYTIKEKKIIQKQITLQGINNLLIALVNVGGVVFSIILMSLGKISIGTLGAVMALIGTLMNDTKELLVGFATFLSKKYEATQFYDLMDLPMQNNVGAEGGSISSIEVKKLKYRYPLTKKYIIDDINLIINKGEKIALVGENGMGKTTFVKLITGIISPSDGELLINGVRVADISAKNHYDKLSAVFQESSRYMTFSVEENVYLGDTLREIDNARIDESLLFSGFDYCEKNTLLGKDIGGTDLSGGQWQKLAIARAAYRGRDFIILDEPTSNLDSLAEAEVFNKYIALSKDKTVMFVTHRISIASLADRIIVFSNGKVVQDGTHSQLIKLEGEYSKLYKEQAKWYNR